jgi:hypothetical protein
MKLRTIHEWREVAHNPPSCCVNCDFYSGIDWSEKEICRKYEQKPPQEYAEAENECPSWVPMIPF